MAIEARMSVISICEELAYPWHRNPELANKIDRLAEENGVIVLGPGVNPGFSSIPSSSIAPGYVPKSKGLRPSG
jgi:hypothetical protein